MDSPTTNYTGASALEADASPVEQSLLRFDVAGVGHPRLRKGEASSALRQLSDLGGVFYSVAVSVWQEGTVTWNTAPAPDRSPFASLGRVASGS